MSCPLCEMSKLTEWKLVICKCKTHPDKWMLVWGEHVAKPSTEDLFMMIQILLRVFPGKEFRGPNSIKDHYHLHEV